MSYFSQIAIKAADSPTIDAFNRIRVSNPVTIFNSKQLHTSAPEIWGEATTGTGTTSTHDPDTATTELGVAATTAGSLTRQTFRRFNYQPGKSQFILMTGNVRGLVANVTKRIGMFNAQNGVFFEFDDVASVVVRSYATGSAVDTAVAQSSWNVDKMDGTGPSGITLDWTKTQIFTFDYEWLGVGRVRFGVVIDGLVHYVHYANHANNETVVYMSTPNLPLTYSISNDGTGAVTTLDHICSTVLTEGGADPTGDLESHERTGVSVATGDINAIILLRLNSAHLDDVVGILDFSVVGTATNDILLTQLILNPTVAGTALTWNTTMHESVDVAEGITGDNTVTGGKVLLSNVGTGRSTIGGRTPDPTVTLGVDQSDVSDVLALVVTSANAATIWTALNWTVLS